MSLQVNDAHARWIVSVWSSSVELAVRYTQRMDIALQAQHSYLVTLRVSTDGTVGAKPTKRTVAHKTGVRHSSNTHKDKTLGVAVSVTRGSSTTLCARLRARPCV